MFESYRHLDKILDDAKKDKDRLSNDKYRGQRAIGVVYNPQYEKYGNYVPTILPLRYDAFLFIDETHALHPLHMPTIDDKDFPEFSIRFTTTVTKSHLFFLIIFS